MRYLHWLLLSSLSLLFSCSPGHDKPNIILIMADDLGYGDLACYGSSIIETPNLDAMASEGIKFLDYHSNGAVCSPTRAALLTGCYQQRAGIEAVVTAANHRVGGLDPEIETIADIARYQGYKTAIFGKWHVGYDTAHSPIQNGFDEYIGFVSGNVDYHSHIDQTGVYDWWQGTDTIVEPGYLTDLITDHSVSFISRNAKQPFFLYIAHGAPHYPYQGRRDKPERLLSGEFLPGGSIAQKKIAYKEMIEVLDEGIGRVFDALETNDLMHNTLVFFCSDNGATPAIGSNGLLKGSKATLWEGGHRVPAMLWYPDEYAPSENSDLILSMDLMPSFARLMGYNDIESLTLDGYDFTTSLNAEPKEDTRTAFWRFNQYAAVRSGDWKYVRFKDEEFLFDLKNDISEKNNLFDSNSEISTHLKTKLATWEAEMNQYEYFTGR